jgi:two-component system KDP operon response regulator KdpE
MSAKIRVLVIDDEAAILRFLKPALEANNYEMASAGTVAEGIKRIAAETPDIVLLDLGLPDGDGKDVIKRAREWSDLPIIVLSAREREAEKIEALDFGADDYVNKPFNVGELLARMRTAFATGCNARPKSLFCGSATSRSTRFDIGRPERARSSS